MHGITITDIAFGETKVKDDGSGGDPQIMVRFDVQEFIEPDGTATPLQAGYPRTTYMVCSEKGREYALLKLRHAGWTGSNFQTLKSDMVGQFCYANCKHEVNKGTGKYAGTLGEKWDLAMPQKEAKPLETKPGLERKLNALFGKELKTTAPAKPAMSPAHSAAVHAQAPVVSGVGTLPPHGEAPPDDDVPF